MQCTYEYLYKSGDGYVVRCRQCNYFQVAFNCALLTLDEPSFLQLREQLKEKIDLHPGNIPPGCKSIALNTPVPGYCLLLSIEEAALLFEHLDGADTEWRSKALLNLFNHPGED